MSAGPPNEPVSGVFGIRSRVLVVDDEPELLEVYRRILAGCGHEVSSASDGREASEILKGASFDVIVSDIAMPGMDGIQLLRAVRERDLDVPVILVTGTPAVETAVRAIEYGALRYLVKPVRHEELLEVVQYAVRLHKLAKIKRQAVTHLGPPHMQFGDRASLEASFHRGMKSLWTAFQPIVCWPKREVYGYEALLRTDEPSLPHPAVFLGCAERLGRLDDLGRAIRQHIALSDLEKAGDAFLFVNLHARDLFDESLYLPKGPFSRMAPRVVLEITERASLEDMRDVRSRARDLRQMGFRIAVDDLGAGYAGLSSFALLQPEVVKLDLSIVRDVDKEPVKRKLIGAFAALCREMGVLVVCEGVETREELSALADLGCDHFQGFLFGRPARGFPPVRWEPPGDCQGRSSAV